MCRAVPRQSDVSSDMRNLTVGLRTHVCLTCMYDAAHRCSRPRSKERAVVVAWEKRLMVVGDAPESIQYPSRDTCGGRRGKGRGSPALSHLWVFLRTLTKLRFVLDEDSYMVPELDGVRIFSRSTHEFLHEVPGEALTEAPHTQSTGS